jgi:hypothetical protein
MTKATKPNSIRIMVVTTADDLDDEFNLHQPLRVVFERALTLVGGHSTPDQFRLEYDGHILALERKIGELADELAWTSPVELELVPSPTVV